jgi:uncharacterized membrane protein HdeD (DUF308 family)
MIIAGIACMFTPLITFLSTGYFLGAVLLVYGIAGIIKAITQKGSVLEWVLNILSIAVGVVALFKPGAIGEFDRVLLIIVAIWFVVQGVIQIIIAFQEKGVVKGWWWNLIGGILGIILGIYCFAHPMVTAISVGILVGFFFVESGVSLITMALAVNDME